ncbi:hypothetical protein ACIQF6_14880 [Kitasatospora sp. NPDC092948]|uniref:hypothetical protein n=1 Tax=Kitasatospora sp. NPDC092948 TaxID=3364088 RepID=UPI0037F329D4
MTDRQLATEFARRQIAEDRADLLREIERVADAARYIHTDAQAGRAAFSLAGNLARLNQYVTTALHHAARLQGVEETAAYLTSQEG